MKHLPILKNTLWCLFFWAFASTAIAQNTLNYYLQTAVKNSPIFLDNQHQVQSLRVDSMLVDARLKPQINGYGNGYFAPVISGYGYDETSTNKGNYSALLGVNYPIVGHDIVNNQYASITLQKQYLELTTKLSERDIKQAVTSQYITVYGEQQLLSNAVKVLEILEKENLILKRSTERGIYKQTDYLSFLVNYKQQQLICSQQKLQIQNDVYLLQYLCGSADTTIVALSDPDLNFPHAISVEQSSPFRQYALDSLQLQNSAEQLRYQYKPKLNVFADAGYNSTLQIQPEKNFGAGIGLNLSIPIYDGDQQQLQLEKLRLAENIRQNHLSMSKKQFAIRQVQLQQQITEVEKLIATAEEQLSLSKTLLTANNQLLEAGEVKIADYIVSMANYISSQTAAQQLISNRMQLINQLNYLNY